MLDPGGLLLRAELFRSIRAFFSRHGFLEVDTPVRLPTVLPERAIIPVPSGSWFLQSSPELCMKRLLAGGCERIFQICPCFRGGERGSLHLEEFTMLEWYRRDADYTDLMEDCLQLLRFVIDELGKDPRLEAARNGSCFGTVSLDGVWERLTVHEAFTRHAPVSAEQALLQGSFDELLVTAVEPHLGRATPTFLCDYPASCAALARLKDGDEAVAERFELYIDAVELANGFSELCDPVEQRARFAAEIAEIEEKRGVRYPMPEHFLSALEQIGRAAGIAFGLDRLLMLLAGSSSIDEVVSFSSTDWGADG